MSGALELRPFKWDAGALAAFGRALSEEGASSEYGQGRLGGDGGRGLRGNGGADGSDLSTAGCTVCERRP